MRREARLVLARCDRGATAQISCQLCHPEVRDRARHLERVRGDQVEVAHRRHDGPTRGCSSNSPAWNDKVRRKGPVRSATTSSCAGLTGVNVFILSSRARKLTRGTAKTPVRRRRPSTRRTASRPECESESPGPAVRYGEAACAAATSAGSGEDLQREMKARIASASRMLMRGGAPATAAVGSHARKGVDVTTRSAGQQLDVSMPGDGSCGKENPCSVSPSTLILSAVHTQQTIDLLTIAWS